MLTMDFRIFIAKEFKACFSCIKEKRYACRVSTRHLKRLLKSIKSNSFFQNPTQKLMFIRASLKIIYDSYVFQTFCAQSVVQIFKTGF